MSTKREMVCLLGDVGQADTPLIGTKAAALAELARAGFPVPAGLVLTTSAYLSVIEPLRSQIQRRVTPDVVDDPAEVELAAQEVRDWLEQQEWPANLVTLLSAALEQIRPAAAAAAFAARTSLTSEELATAFGAGVRRAVLGLGGLEEIERGAARCWGALWTSRSMYYRQVKKIPQLQVALAVLVQPMLPAQSAGKMFTADPLTGAGDAVQIDSIWGLGEPLAQARVRPDHFVVSKADLRIRETRIEDKAVKLLSSPGGGLEQEAVSPEQVQAPSLADDEATALATMGMRIEEQFGRPQDIEWALAEGRFYILQSRPIASRAS